MRQWDDCRYDFCFGFVCLESWYLAISIHLYSISPLRPHPIPPKPNNQKTKKPQNQKPRHQKTKKHNKHKIAPRRREDTETWVLQSYFFWFTVFVLFCMPRHMDIWKCILHFFMHLLLWYFILCRGNASSMTHCIALKENNDFCIENDMW
jgi:hypothetical protein